MYKAISELLQASVSERNDLDENDLLFSCTLNSLSQK